MWTYKQLEALFWIARLGSFASAADKLHTTQSAISRRIRDLEEQLGVELFDRSARSSRLTAKGEEMVALAGSLLAQRDAAVEQFRKPDALERRLRLGVTELTAMTWLPQLIALVQQYYPKVTLEPEVDSSVGLRDSLLRNSVDLIVVPDAFHDPRFACTNVGQVLNCWMCKPGLVPPGKVLTLNELSRYRLLSQGGMSGTGLIYDRWIKEQGVQINNQLQSSSLLALIGLTVSGLGVSYVPYECFSYLVDSGRLQWVDVKPVLPPTPYVMIHRSEERSALLAAIVMLAQSCCDFSRLFQDQVRWPLQDMLLP